MTEGWLTATLAEKVPSKTLRQEPRLLHGFLAGMVQGLKVEWSFSTSHGWLRVQARGEDGEAFVNLLQEKLGRAPVEASRVERWDVLKGFVTESGRVGFGVYVDIGVVEPIRKDALYPLHRMRAQLADGIAKSCREILEENAFADFFPLKVLVTEVEGEKLTVELTDETRDLLLSWRKLPFDRVIAIGIEKQQAEDAVRSAGLQLDVIRIEPLSLLVQSLICKIGTDAPGIIAKIGGRLRGTALASFRTPIRFL